MIVEQGGLPAWVELACAAATEGAAAAAVQGSDDRQLASLRRESGGGDSIDVVDEATEGSSLTSSTSGDSDAAVVAASNQSAATLARRDAAETRRRALWAITSWLSVEHSDSKVKFVLAGGLEPLLQVTPANSTAECQRYAELALSKVLCARGQQLGFRTEVLQLQMSAAATTASRTELWRRIAHEFLDA